MAVTDPDKPPYQRHVDVPRAHRHARRQIMRNVGLGDEEGREPLVRPARRDR